MRRNWYKTIYTLLLNSEDAITASNYPVSTAYIDVSSYSHCAFLVGLGLLDSALTFQVYQDTSATETASIKILTGASEVTTATDDDEVFLIEFATEALDSGNNFHYVTLTVTGAAGANDYGSIWFFGWNAKTLPVTQPSTFPATNHTILAG